MARNPVSSLSSPIIYKTSAPFASIDPSFASKPTEIGTLESLVQHSSQTVSVESTSELLKLQTSVSVLKTREGQYSSFKLVSDANGRPMIISIASDGVRLKLSSTSE